MCPLTALNSSYQWCSPCDRKESAISPARYLYARESRTNLPQHRIRLLWHGSRFPNSCRESEKDCAGLLESVRRVPAYKGFSAGGGGCDAEGDSVWVSRCACQRYQVCGWKAKTITVKGGLAGCSERRYSRNGWNSADLSSGVRPYGISLLIAGWDSHRGQSLYQVDPSGSYWAWKASAIGKNMVNGKTFLEKR